MQERKKRILVIDDDVRFVQSMKEFLQSREDFEYAGGADTTAKALELVKDKLPHVILTDIILKNGDEGSDFIEAVEEMAAAELKIRPMIFIMSKNSFYETLSVKKGLPFIEKGSGVTPEIIIKRIARNFSPSFANATYQNIEPTPPKDIRKRAREQMELKMASLGLLHFKGCKYIVYAVVYLAETQGDDSPKLNIVYDLVAKEYKVTKSSVESAMRKAIQGIWDKASEDDINKYYGGFVSRDKGAPTNLMFISHYTSEIKRDYYSED